MKNKKSPGKNRIKVYVEKQECNNRIKEDKDVQESEDLQNPEEQSDLS